MKTYKVNYHIVNYKYLDNGLHEDYIFRMEYINTNDDPMETQTIIKWEKKLGRKHKRPVKIRSFSLLTCENYY